MPSGLILAIDQGTTNTKALLVGRTGEPVFGASCPVALVHGTHGHVEQDPYALWESVCKVIADCAKYAEQKGETIHAVAISNQRETALAWDAETGRPIAPAVSWQCGRSAEICHRLQTHARTIRLKTGLPLATLLSAGKWAWLLENHRAVQDTARSEGFG